ncbi:MAG TPA: CHRD domain-containing protein, partial [Nitrososphaeraceae archaeon]
MQHELSLKSTCKIISFTALLSLLFLLAIASSLLMVVDAAPFTAVMSGDQEVPPVDTTATGKTTFRTSNNDTSMKYKVNITGFSEATGAHIHLGK